MDMLKRPVWWMVIISSSGLCLNWTINQAFASALEPAPPAPSMKTLTEVEPGLPILSLPYDISESESYCLTINRNVTGTGISVAADVNGNARLDIEETIYILNSVAMLPL